MTRSLRQTTESRLLEIQSQLFRQLQLLQENLQQQLAPGDELQVARHLLEALPLANDQFARAVLRLDNVAHYLRYGEPGAAGYELRLLLSALRGLLLAPPAQPHRRLRTTGTV